jgi:hypothetical protein
MIDDERTNSYMLVRIASASHDFLKQVENVDYPVPHRFSSAGNSIAFKQVPKNISCAITVTLCVEFWGSQKPGSRILESL